MKLNYGTLVFLAVVVLVFLIFAWQLPWTAPRIAGVAIAVPSFLLFAIARIQLGKAFSIQAKATTLVTTGLYSRILNPIYVFGSLMIAGVLLWSGRPWFLLIFAVVIPMQILRSRKEAKALEEKFGPAYQEYKQKTWF
ncbi:MAG: isoprenylcysteine carboxylmethyltransferase family protein [Terracidiphilus sp.]